MADFIFEILSEEIPARMQVKAAEDLKKKISVLLLDHNLAFSLVQTYVTPRRLCAVVTGLEKTTGEKQEERRGPRITAPEKAIEGFLTSVGFSSLENCEQRNGYYYALITTPAQQVMDVLPAIVRLVLRQFIWPKSMRWPQATIPWVRPIRSIATVFDGKPLCFSIDELGLSTSNVTYGHRFLSPDPIQVISLQQYKEDLKRAYVVLDHADRQSLIEKDLEALAASRGYALEKDERLLAEVAGLVEYPVCQMGAIESAYMVLPKAVLSTSMRIHQKYFTFVTPDGKMAPFFGFVSNTIAQEDGLVSLKGYERVLKARLEDAHFFYAQDSAVPLDAFVKKLYGIVFYEKLGTLGQKVERLQAMAQSAEAKRAAYLCKADLVSFMVGEFPELQGLMGGFYAHNQGESVAVAGAIRDHYQPQGPDDHCPHAPLSIEVALADKIDTLVGFFGIGDTPTGSKDPYALRRAALGIIRLVRENSVQDLDLGGIIDRSITGYTEQGVPFKSSQIKETISQFILDRLDNVLKTEGIRPDYIKAVFATLNLNGSFGLNIWSLAKRTEALRDFLESSQGASLQAAFRRANGILYQEQGEDLRKPLHAEDFTTPQEKNLYAQLTVSAKKSKQYLERHEYICLMDELSALKGAVDDFFTLKINDDDLIIRERRLGLLAYLIAQITPIADFTQLVG